MNRWITIIQILGAITAIGLPSHGATQEKDVKDPEGMLPAIPQKLFIVLPGDMKSWELKRSTGEIRLGDWVESRVVRVFEQEVEAGINEGKSEFSGGEKITLRTQISVTDTGKFPDSIAAFTDFEAGTEDNIERSYIEKYPAVIIRYDENDLEIKMLVEGRFLVRFSMENQPEKNLKEWLRRCKFSKLKGIPDTKNVPLPALISVVKIDQLTPKKNKAYHLATTSRSQLAADLKADEILEKKLLGEIPSIPGELDFVPSRDAQ